MKRFMYGHWQKTHEPQQELRYAMREIAERLGTLHLADAEALLLEEGWKPPA